MVEGLGFNNLQTLSDTSDLILPKTGLSFPGALAQQSRRWVGAAPPALDEADVHSGHRDVQAAGHHGVDHVSGSRAAGLCCSCRASPKTTVWHCMPDVAPSPVAAGLFSAVQGPYSAAVTYFHILVWQSLRKKKKNPDKTPKPLNNKNINKDTSDYFLTCALTFLSCYGK